MHLITIFFKVIWDPSDIVSTHNIGMCCYYAQPYAEGVLLLIESVGFNLCLEGHIVMVIRTQTSKKQIVYIDEIKLVWLIFSAFVSLLLEIALYKIWKLSNNRSRRPYVSVTNFAFVNF